MNDMECAANAHSNLNTFAAIVAILEGGCVYQVSGSQQSAQNTATAVIRLCRTEQTRQLRIYDAAKERTHE